MAFVVFLTFVVAMALYPNQGHGLQCFECADMKVIGEAPDSSVDLQTNPACQAGSITAISDLPSRTCSSDRVCVAASGTATARDRNGNFISYSVTTRTCGKTDALGCSRETDHALEMMPSGSGIVDVRFKGELCYCNKDYCSPVSCPDGFSKIAGYCMEWWMVASLVASLVVMITLVTCCCCCCCCCCKPCASGGKTKGSVIEREPAAFENQLYVVMAGHPNSVGAELDTKPTKAW